MQNIEEGTSYPAATAPGYQPAPAPAQSSNKWKWIALAVVSLGVIGGVVGTIALKKTASPKAVEPMAFKSYTSYTSAPTIATASAFTGLAYRSTPTKSSASVPTVSSSKSTPTTSSASVPTVSSSKSTPTKSSASVPTVSSSKSNPTTSSVSLPTEAIYSPTAEELVSPLGHYRLDYAQTSASWDSGYYYVNKDATWYGSYAFKYDEDAAKRVDSNPYSEYIYTFDYTPKGASSATRVMYAPLGRSQSASGLYHHDDYTVSEKGYYSMVEGDKSEKGTYYYYRIGRQSGSNGELYEATFYYLYFPSERSSIAPRTFLVRPTPSPTRAPTRPPMQTYYEPTADELASPLGHYRLDYAQTVTADSGYYYVEGADSRYGSYWFHYEEEKAKHLDSSTSSLPWLYNFKYKSASTSKVLYTYYAPLGRSKSASGLYHNSDSTSSEKGMYFVRDGSTTVEEGTYYYYRIGGKNGGWGGYYSEATFYYLYFPSTRSTSRMPGYGRV